MIIISAYYIGRQLSTSIFRRFSGSHIVDRNDKCHTVINYTVNEPVADLPGTMTETCPELRGRSGQVYKRFIHRAFEGLFYKNLIH
jgi:hypothetical protein